MSYQNNSVTTRRDRVKGKTAILNVETTCEILRHFANSNDIIHDGFDDGLKYNLEQKLFWS